MRVVWRDSTAKERKTVKYRGHYAEGRADGWTTTIPGDNNIYRSHYCALNAIDDYLGGSGQLGAAKRKGYGIQIIGTKERGRE